MDRYTRSLALALLVAAMCMSSVSAQTELELSRASLMGLGRFAVSVQLEGSAEIAGNRDLDVVRLGSAIRKRLSEEQVVILAAEDELPGSPRLWIHINAMDAGQGIIPFDIEIQVQQLARLARNGFEAPMVTWESSLVGVVSHDRLVVIRDAVFELLDEFIVDYHAANGDVDTSLPRTIR